LDKRTANRPPETMLVCSPPDSSTGIDYKVHLSWSGSDPDGTVDHYDFIMVDHPAVKDNIDGSGAETVVITIPQPDDPRWVSSSSTDSVFVTLADTLRNDPQPSDSTGTPDEIRDMLWERWHTFFIRAVDDKGAPDASPDYVSFNATNIAPQVWLTDPVLPGVALNVRPVVRLHWDGQDPVGDGDMIEPVASRWVLIDTQIDSHKRPLSYPDSLYVLPGRFAWSPWVRWDAEDQAGRSVVLRNLKERQSLPDGRVAGVYVFAVQVKDEAGAISPVFDRYTALKNNAVSMWVIGSIGPLLTVRDDLLGVCRNSWRRVTPSRWMLLPGNRWPIPGSLTPRGMVARFRIIAMRGTSLISIRTRLIGIKIGVLPARKSTRAASIRGHTPSHCKFEMMSRESPPQDSHCWFMR